VTNILIYYATNQLFMMCPKGCKLTPGPRSCKAGQFGGRATDVHRCGSPFHFNRVLATFVLSFTPHIDIYFKQHTLSLINGTFLQGGSPNGSSAREVDMSLAVMSHLHHQLHLESGSHHLVILAGRWCQCSLSPRREAKGVFS